MATEFGRKQPLVLLAGAAVVFEGDADVERVALFRTGQGDQPNASILGLRGKVFKTGDVTELLVEFEKHFNITHEKTSENKIKLFFAS